MSDLISRRAAIKAIDDLPNCYNGYSDTYDKAYIIGVLEELPSVEPKRGRWEDVEEVLEEGITDGTPYTIMSVGYKCSECGNEMGNLWSFCPNCGAKMDEVEDERTD